MKYLKQFEGVSKGFTTQEHIENIEDILMDFTDDKLFKLNIYDGVRDRGNRKLSRTFLIKLSLTDEMAWEMLTPGEKKKYQSTWDRSRREEFEYGRPFTHYVRKQIASHLLELKEMAVVRLKRFDYRHYKDVPQSEYDTTLSFYVTFQYNKFKR